MTTTTIQIKRSTTNTTPESLSPGELAFSFVSNTFFIGDPTGNVISLLANSVSGLAQNALSASGGTVSGDLTIEDNIYINDIVNLYSSWQSISSGLPTVVHAYDASSYATCRFTIQINTPTVGYHALEFMVLTDGVNVCVQEYAEMFTNGSLGTFNADLVEGYIQLTFTPTYDNSIVKLARYGVTA